ncbi:hypothetical protein [Stenotrophomonas sepilia]
MNNPYEIPASDAQSGRPNKASPAHSVASILIALLCVLQFLGVCLDVAMRVTAGVPGSDGAPIRVLPMAVLMLMPLSLALGGVFLAFGRTVSGVFFAAFLAQYLLKGYATGQFKILPIVFGLTFLAYAVWRWKAGQLKGWPAAPVQASDCPGTDH